VTGSVEIAFQSRNDASRGMAFLARGGGGFEGMAALLSVPAKENCRLCVLSLPPVCGKL
jgi:hypothetical protein